MLKHRVIVGLLLVAFCLAAIFLLPMLWTALLFCLFMGAGAWEWSFISGIESKKYKMFYALFILLLCFVFYFYDIPVLYIVIPSVLWWAFVLNMLFRYKGLGSLNYLRGKITKILMGIVSLVSAWAGLIYLLKQGDMNLVIMLFLIVWATDIGAYFGGKKFGRSQLAVFVSPGKTVEGVVGGVISALIATLLFGLTMSVTMGSILLLLLVAFITALATVIGDLFESMLKRESGLKDSGRIFPGHGGVLDRIDGLLAAVPSYVLFIALFGV